MCLLAKDGWLVHNIHCCGQARMEEGGGGGGRGVRALSTARLFPLRAVPQLVCDLVFGVYVD